MKKIIFFILALCWSAGAHSQLITGNLPVELAKLPNSLSIEKYTGLFFDSSGRLPLRQVPMQHFVPLHTYPYKNNIPGQLITKPLYLAFTLKNSSDSLVTCSLFPGSMYIHMTLFKMDANGQLTEIENPNEQKGFVFLQTGPGEQTSYFLRLQFGKTPFNNIRARLVSSSFLPYFKMNLDNPMNDKKVIGLLLSGILLMMILFALVNYFIRGRREFLYNCLYSTCMFLLIFFVSYQDDQSARFRVFFTGYFDLFLLIMGTIAYLAFTRSFLNTRTSHRKVDRFLLVQEWILLVLMLVYSIVYFFTDLYNFQELLENIMKMIVLVAAAIYIIIALVEKNKLMNYLAIGSAAQVFFSIISFALILSGVSAKNIFGSAMFYFELGVVVSVIFFLLGLSYKIRMELIEKIQEQEAMKLEVEKKAFETQLAILNAQQEERNRISADMHDDLGAGMTTIRLYSELAKNRIGDQVIPEIEKISASADELLNKMNAIIWSMSSSNDSFGNMLAYIRSYALEYFEDTGINCKIYIPEHLPDLVVNGEIRRNVFLVVKEALHNIVKHANATEVEIQLSKEPSGLLLTIRDNGKGIDMENLRQFGNGLKNMKKRSEAVNMDLVIENQDGTIVKLFRQTMD